MVIGYFYSKEHIKIAEVDISPEDLLKNYPTGSDALKLIYNAKDQDTISSMKDFIDADGKYIFISYLFVWKELENGVLKNPKLNDFRT